MTLRFSQKVKTSLMNKRLHSLKMIPFLRHLLIMARATYLASEARSKSQYFEVTDSVMLLIVNPPFGRV